MITLQYRDGFLPYISVNRPEVYMCPPILKPLPHLSPPHPSGLPQSTGVGCPASCTELALVICFTYGNVQVSKLFSQITPPLPSWFTILANMSKASVNIHMELSCGHRFLTP